MEVPQSFLIEVHDAIKGINKMLALTGTGIKVTDLTILEARLDNMICRECDGSGMIKFTDGRVGYNVCQNKNCQGHQKVSNAWRREASKPY